MRPESGHVVNSEYKVYSLKYRQHADGIGIRHFAWRHGMDELPEQDPEKGVRSREIRVFVFLTVVMAPMIAVAVVASYGLMIWLYQMLAGPPTG